MSIQYHVVSHLTSWSPQSGVGSPPPTDAEKQNLHEVVLPQSHYDQRGERQYSILTKYDPPELDLLLVDVLQPGVTQGLDCQPAHHLLHLGGEDGQGGEDGEDDPV